MARSGWSKQPESWKGGSTRRWRAFRAEWLAENPVCVGPVDPTTDIGLETCGAEATVVDHVDGTDYATERYDRTKVRSLCAPCHNVRTGHQGQAAMVTKKAMKEQAGEPSSRDWWSPANA